MKVQLIKNLFLLSSLSFVVAGCGKDDGEDLGEGSEPGWCDDGADNDGDGYYDCEDNDCYNAPVCGGTGDSGDPDADNDNDGFTPAEGDCNDNNDQVNPNAVETCNGIDDDCNKAIDDNPTDGEEYFQDSDNDKYGDPSNSIKACDEAPNGYVDNDDDCNDANALIYPGANEISWNGTDEDCDGTDFNGKKCLEDAGEAALYYMSYWGDAPYGWIVPDNINSVSLFGVSQSWNIEDQVVYIDGTDSTVEQGSPGIYDMSLAGGVALNQASYQFYMSFDGSYNETCQGYLPWINLEFEGAIEVEVSGQNVSGEATFTPSWSGVAQNDLVLEGLDSSGQPDGSCNITTINTVISLANQFFPQYMPFNSILGWVDSGFQETLDDISRYLENLTEQALEYTCAP